MKKSRNLCARQNFEPERALEMFIELQDGDVSEMLDLWDYGDDKSDSQYLLLNPRSNRLLRANASGTDMRHPPSPSNFLESHDLEEPGPSTSSWPSNSSDRATEDQQPSAKKVNQRNRGEYKWCYKDFEPYIEYQQVICAYTPPQTESMSPAECFSFFSLMKWLIRYC